MALPNLGVWEIRTTGNANNGGGYNDRIPGTSVDYSQQNASQLSKADLACAAASVTVTSATNGFTAAMVGNYMRIRAGANFTVGFYEIVQFNGVGSVNLDRVPVTGIGANGVAEVGGAQIQLSAVVVAAFVALNTIYIQNGIYAAHPAVTTNTGPITIYGYNAARGDAPTGNNRPVLQMGANLFTISYDFKGKHFRLEGSDYNMMIQFATTVIIENIKITNTRSVAGNVTCFSHTASECPMTIIDCEFSGTAGSTSYGVNVNRGLTLLNSFIHNLTYGVKLNSSTNNSFANILFNIFAGIEQSAIIQTGSVDLNCINNVFANCGRSGILFGVSAFPIIVNNSFSNCVVAGLEVNSFLGKNNNFFDCGTPAISSINYPLRLCDNNTYVSPQFVTPGSNYALQRTSGLIDRAFSMRLGV